MQVQVLPGDSEGTTLSLSSGTHEICLEVTNKCDELIRPQVCCQVECLVPFLQCDCNDDDRGCNLADGIFIISNIFVGGGVPNCQSACDVNGDGSVNIADAIYLFNYVLGGGPPPPPPFPDCGLASVKECAVSD